MKRWILVWAVLCGLALAACANAAPEATLPPVTTAAETTEAPTQTQPLTEPAETTVPETEATTEATTVPVTEAPVTLRSEFLAAMDSYEAFMDRYIAFMVGYNEDPANEELAAQLPQMTQQLAQEEQAFWRWDAENMNELEYNYHLEVQSRVQRKLLEANLVG